MNRAWAPALAAFLLSLLVSAPVAASFDYGSDAERYHRLTGISGSVFEGPHTILVWGEVPTLGVTQVAFSSQRPPAFINESIVGVDTTNSAFGHAIQGTTSLNAVSATTVSANVPFCVVFVVVAANDWRIWLNGAGKGTQTGYTLYPSSQSVACVGTLNRAIGGSYWWTGKIYCVAVWDVALSDDDAVRASKVYPPLVRPGDLAHFWWVRPLSETDWTDTARTGDHTRWNLTATGSPTAILSIVLPGSTPQYSATPPPLWRCREEDFYASRRRPRSRPWWTAGEATRGLGGACRRA